MPGARVDTEMGKNYTRVCMLCAWLTWHKGSFHDQCRARYHCVQVIYYWLVATRSALAVITFPFAWRYFGSEGLVLGPTVVSVFFPGAYYGYKDPVYCGLKGGV
jgi:hypothetical protein